MPDASPTYVLHPVTTNELGERLESLDLAAPGPYVAGRSSGVDWSITDQTVSRRHAEFTYEGGAWRVGDLGSRHGTSVNGRGVGADERVQLSVGDLVAFGQWVCRFQPAGATRGMTPIEPAKRDERVSVVSRTDLLGVAQKSLDALLTVSREFNAAATREEVATAAVNAVRSATGCARVMMIERASATEFSELASTASGPSGLSRSLVDAAAADRCLVELRAMSDAGDQAHSIMSLEIRAAVCAPVFVNKGVGAFLYLDTRRSESALTRDASAFCQSLAELAGMALERVINAELAARHERLERDLGAARRAQELLMPASSGRVGRVTYAYESRAGRVVAGDLFDIFPLPDGRTAMLLGDVSGKGVGAAVLMAAAQSQLRTQLSSGLPLAHAVEAVGRDLNVRTATGTFVTLIAGVINPESETIEIVDAGHGFAVLVAPNGEATKIDTGGGFPLGIVEDGEYESTTLGFPTGSQFVVFSDGVVEQMNPAGEEFGYDAALGVVAGAGTTEEISAAVLQAVQRHAQGDLADDLTVAAGRLEASAS